MKPLYLYEEVMLLAVRDEEGTFSPGYVEHAVSSAILAEWLLERRIAVDGKTKNKLVDLIDVSQVGDPVMDACLEKFKLAKRRASVSDWVSRLSNLKNLRHQVAEGLCARKILRADEDKVLFLSLIHI